MQPLKNIFSLGTGKRGWDGFTGLLKRHGIEMVIDVRSFPVSRFPHFKKDFLVAKLAEEGFGYLHLGKELGGYRREGYEAYTQTLSYLAGMELLERMASRCLSVFICAETLPWRCHRRFIARSLAERGWKVTHLIDEKRVWEDDVSEDAGSEEP
ncbi:MAG TPA: DUF488 domain-containing protein [Thermodesulfobacteriota bacterium]|nr:DUF488 domain-containing protein [Thermodesulfobacteriota bacterium]